MQKTLTFTADPKNSSLVVAVSKAPGQGMVLYRPTGDSVKAGQEWVCEVGKTCIRNLEKKFEVAEVRPISRVMPTPPPYRAPRSTPKGKRAEAPKVEQREVAVVGISYALAEAIAKPAKAPAARSKGPSKQAVARVKGVPFEAMSGKILARQAAERAAANNANQLSARA